MRRETALVPRHLGRHSRRTFGPTLLPFLYNTRTLRAVPAQWSPCITTKSFHKTAAWREETDYARHAYQYAQETEEQLETEISTPMRYASERSSLTNAEREIFEQIYQEAEQLKQDSVVTEEQEVERLIVSHSDQSEEQRLDSLFEQALPKLRNSLVNPMKSTSLSPLDKPFIQAEAKARTEARSKDVQEKSTNVQVRRVRVRDELDTTKRRDEFARLDEPFFKKHGFTPDASYVGLLGDRSDPSSLAHPVTSGPKNTGSITDTKARELAVASYDDIQAVENLFSGARTDTELWRVLETQVFSRVQELVGSLTQSTPAPATTKSKKAKKKSKATAASDVTIDEQGEVLSAAASLVATPAPPSDTVPLRLATLRQTYARHVWAAQRVFRVRFPYSPYAVAILPTIKSLGPVSYALAASTELYDELLYMRWRVYRDPHACADILGEMLDRGIETSPRTRAVFRDAGLEWLAARNQATAEATAETTHKQDVDFQSNAGNNSAFKVRRVIDQEDYVPPKVSAFQMAWWGLEGVQSGFRRWQLLEKEDLARIAQIKEGEARAQQVESREDAFDEAIERLAAPTNQVSGSSKRDNVSKSSAVYGSTPGVSGDAPEGLEANVTAQRQSRPQRPRKTRATSTESSQDALSDEAEIRQDKLAVTA